MWEDISSENVLFGTKAPLILLMSAFYCKKSAVFNKNTTLLKAIVSEMC